MTATVEGPDFIALQVTDVPAAAAFFERHLGLRRAPLRRGPSSSPPPRSRSLSMSRWPVPTFLPTPSRASVRRCG